MRLLIAALLCSPLLLASPARGEQVFPYTTLVSAEDVYVRSGPGRNYYPTDKLRRGQEVEVYRHDPGGWCAIRPIDGSFTWVSGRYLKPTDDNLAVVTSDGVSARVGSRFSDIRDVIQVRLQKGELVEVLKGTRRGDRKGWYKIAPPSGEFRWVSAKYLDADYPRDGVRITSPQEQRPHHSAQRQTEETTQPSNGSAALQIPAAALADESLRTRSSQTRSLTAKEYEAELARIEMELSVMVIEDPTVWSFDVLRQRMNLLLDQSQTAVERGHARRLANKIARFDDIKQRQDMVFAMRDGIDRDSRLLAKLRPRDDGADIDDRFDGVGQLTQVVSPKLGAPRYALTDDTGNVRCYVTPAPGLNVQSYMGRRVGVTGTRGYVPDQRTGHIMARHITPLEGRMLR